MTTPGQVTVTVQHNGNEFRTTRRQAVDRLGRPTEHLVETIEAATEDARAWVRRQQ